jgi:hypothetical protein
MVHFDIIFDMKYLFVLPGYLKWHYGKALFTTFSLWINFSVFIFNFFSIKSLATNFFTPWKRLAETYPKGFHLGEIAGIFILNTMMRIVGMILRFFMLIIGILIYLIFLFSLPIIITVWIVIPIAIATLIVLGFVLIFLK